MNRTARKIIMIVVASVFAFSSAMVLKDYLQMKSAAEFSESISEMVVALATEDHDYEMIDKDITDESAVVQSEGSEDSTEKKSEDPPILVDFNLLCNQNQDIVAWLYCPDTPINYPIVQAADNDFYLRRLLDGSYNTAGTLFMDFRNSEDFSDWNSIIYGHNMKNDSMFGTLPDYKAQSYFEEHSVMYLLTPEQNYKINLLAGFVTPASSKLYSVFNPDEDEKTLLIDSWVAASNFDSGINPASENHFITLSTCSYEYSNARYVLIGILEES